MTKERGKSRGRRSTRPKETAATRIRRNGFPKPRAYFLAAGVGGVFDTPEFG